jgi:hypothetical protein
MESHHALTSPCHPTVPVAPTSRRARCLTPKVSACGGRLSDSTACRCAPHAVAAQTPAPSPCQHWLSVIPSYSSIPPHYNQWSIIEDRRWFAVRPFMKTTTLFGLVAAVALTGFAASAQAGWSVDVSFGLPWLFPPPVVVAAPPCPPPVYCPPVVIRPAPVVVCQPVYLSYPPVVYAAPRYGYIGHRGNGHEHSDHGRGNGGHGYRR